MKHRPVLAALLATAALALVGAAPGLADGNGNGHGVVFVQTNQPSGNQIVVYRRGHDGLLSAAGTCATGGLGGVASPGTESDTLASQGSLALAISGR
jgi:hypothetical protein